MLTGNKFYNAGLDASNLPSEDNYTDWTPSAVGSSYSRGYDIATGNFRATTQPISKYVNMNVPTNNPYQTIDNYKFTLGSVGQTAPKREGAGLGNALMTVLDVMQRPQFMVTNVFNRLTDDNKDSFGDVLKSAFNGITGKEKSSITDTFDNLGWDNDSSKKWYQGGNLLRSIAGFAGDVLLDPTTYLTAGTASLAKGLGTKAVKESLGDSITKVLARSGGALGNEVITKSSDDLAEGISKFLSHNADTAVSKQTVIEAISKQGKQGELASQLAYALGHSTDLSSSTLVKANQDLVMKVLDNGVGSINRDTLKTNMTLPLKQQLDNLMVNNVSQATTAFNRSVGQTLNKKIGGGFASFGVKDLSDTTKLESVRDIVSAVTGASKKNITTEFKSAVVSKLYKGIDSSSIPNAVLDNLSDKEYDILDTLCNSFNVESKIQADKLLGSVQSIGAMRNRTIKKLDAVTSNLEDISGAVKKVEDGLEFSNGLRRVFNTADKAFYLQYHNPFTGTVKPLIELTGAAHSETAKAAWNALIELNPLSPVINKAGQKLGRLGTGVANKFSTEYISPRIGTLADGTIDPLYREVGQDFAKMVTDFSRKENALPQRAIASTRIFKSIPQFFKDENLRKAASIYIERNNSPLAKAGWLYLSGQGLEDGADDVLVKAYDYILTSPTLRTTLDSLEFDSSKIPLVEKIGQQNTLYNTAIAQFDGTNRIDFSDNKLNLIDVGDTDSMDYITRAMTGNIDQSALEGYARIYDNTDDAYMNPLAQPNTKGKSHHKTSDESVDTKLGTKTDSRAAATSDTTGAFLRRANKSALDALAAHPNHTIDFDLASRVARRTMESERVALNKSFISSIEDSIDNVEGFDALVSRSKYEGGKPVLLNGGKTEYWCHPEIANQISRVASIFDDASVASRAVDEVFVNVTNALKTLQTKYNPSFILRNLIGEPMMNWVAGVSPKAHLDARDIMKEVDAEGLFKIGDTTFSVDNAGTTKKLFREYTGEIQPGVKKHILEYTDDVGKKEVATDIDLNAQRQRIIEASGVTPKYYQIGARKLTAMQIMSEFYDQGLGWSGITKGNPAKNMEGMLNQEMLEVTSKNGLVNAAKTFNEKIGKPGDFVETWTRLSHYIDGLSKGMDMQTAAMEVRKYHVDYKDLTTFERKYMRNLMPYYTYMRKNFPMQIKLLIERQNKVNMIGQLVDSMYEAVQRDNGDKELVVPDYLKEGLAIPLGVDDNGNITYLNWGVPIADVARFKYNVKELLTENFFSMWSPMLKNPLEYTMNKNMMYGTDLEGYEGETQDLLPGVAGSPQVSTQTNQAIQSLGILSTLRNAASAGIAAGQQGQNGLAVGLTKALAGSVLPTKNQETVSLQQAYEQRDQLYAYIQQLRAQGINVPQYTPEMQYGTPLLNPWAASDRIAQNEKQGYLGTSNAQLYPGLLRILTGQGG